MRSAKRRTVSMAFRDSMSAACDRLGSGPASILAVSINVAASFSAVRREAMSAVYPLAINASSSWSTASVVDRR